jgi:hypothetical protein
MVKIPCDSTDTNDWFKNCFVDNNGNWFVSNNVLGKFSTVKVDSVPMHRNINTIHQVQKDANRAISGCFLNPQSTDFPIAPSSLISYLPSIVYFLCLPRNEKRTNDSAGCGHHGDGV